MDDTKVKSFLSDLQELMKKHNVSLTKYRDYDYSNPIYSIDDNETGFSMSIDDVMETFKKKKSRQKYPFIDGKQNRGTIL